MRLRNFANIDPLPENKIMKEVPITGISVYKLGNAVSSLNKKIDKKIAKKPVIDKKSFFLMP